MERIPCAMCGYPRYKEEGLLCPNCGHWNSVPSQKPSIQDTASPSVILSDFLYLGTYDDASRLVVLKALGISAFLDTVPYLGNMFKYESAYHDLRDDKTLQFDEAIQFLEQCEKHEKCVLVYCMSGNSRSPAFVIAFLMKSKGWRLVESYRWVKTRRPSVELFHGEYQQLQEYEQKIYGLNDGGSSLLSGISPPPISFGFPKINDSARPPCGVCGHYHRYEEGEVCSICGHRNSVGSEKVSENPSVQVSAFPSVILSEFLYLGSYYDAMHLKLLKALGISRILNTVPSFKYLYMYEFASHCLRDDKTLQFDEAIHFLEQCKKDKKCVLVFCMSGKSRSPAIVIAFLMKSKRWRLAESYQWVKKQRPSVELTHGVWQQLQEYEQKIYGLNDGGSSLLSGISPPTTSFASLKINDSTQPPVFGTGGTPPIFARPLPDDPPTEFTFGAGQAQKSVTGTPPFNANSPPNPTDTDIQMDGS